MVPDPGQDAAPAIAVVIPVGDPRSRAEYVRSWTCDQTCAATDYEVIVVTNGSNPELDAQYRSRLRPHDRLCHAAGNRFELYNAGARSARAPWLLLTEDHCVAETGCVRAVLDFIDDNGCDAAFLQSAHINPTRLGRIEQRLYEEAFERYWSRTDYWDKVRARGFAIRRATYLDNGGMDGEYELFAESAFSAGLHSAGVQIRHIPRAVVRHVNLSTFKGIRNEVWSFGWNECRYRDHHDAGYCETYFGMPQEWAERRFQTPASARWVMSMIWSTVRSQPRGCSTRDRIVLGLELLRRGPAAVFGRGVQTVATRIGCLGALLRYHFWMFSERRQAAAIKAYWEGVCRSARLAYVARLCADDRSGDIPCTGDFTAAGGPPSALTGFSILERWEDKSFRWTLPVAAVLFDLPADDYEAEVDTAALRGPRCEFAFAFFWNDARVPDDSITVDQGRIRFTIRRGMFRHGARQELAIVSAMLRRRGLERRRLGMPVEAIRFRSTKAAIEPSLHGA